MVIRSNYRESASEQFEMLVLGETIDENGEECYIVQLLPKYQSQFQEGDKLDKLRKKLVGDSENLYSIKQVKTVEQLNLFDIDYD